MVTHKSVNTDPNKQIISYTTTKVNQVSNCATMQPLQAFGTAIPLINELDNPTQVLLNQMADKNDVVLMSKANTMLMDGIKVTQRGSYNALETIQEWQEEGIIVSYTEASSKTHNARTISVKHQKGIADQILNIVSFVVDQSIGEVIDKIINPVLEENLLLTANEPKPERDSKLVQDMSDATYATEHVYQDSLNSADYKNKQIIQILQIKRMLDKEPNKFMASTALLEFMYPLLSGGRRDYVISKLFIKYESDRLIDLLESKVASNNPTLKQQVVKWLQAEGKIGKLEIEQGESVDVGVVELVEGDESSVYMEYKNVSHIYTHLEPTSNLLPDPISPCLSNPDPCTTLPPASVTPYIEPLTGYNTSKLVKAYEYKLNHHPEHVNVFNELALLFLCGYEPVNALETRCKQMMIGTGNAFPLSYMRLSTCPRLYGDGKDNLFYCPSSMRQSLSKALNLREWDMRSCHTNILLGLFPKSFPVLKGMIERDSIWKEYEAYFKSKDCVFNKPVVKAFHYATILGGGKAAYREAIKKLRKDGIVLNEDESSEVIGVYNSHPVVREMKAFINKWGRGTKEITYPTGETHEVIQPICILNPSTGKKDLQYLNSNVLKVFSGLLRAWEMILISYVGLSHPEAFTILLHQHDGITVVEHVPNAFQLAQEAMREISNLCFPSLSRPIELEIKI